MFRGLGKGIAELIKRRGSTTEMPRLPEATGALNEALGQGQPSQVQSNPQSSAPLDPGSGGQSKIMPRRASTAGIMSNLATPTAITPPKIIPPKPEKELSPENWVKVRIWTSKTRSGSDAYAASAMAQGGNVGHATLETSKIYASIWPNWNEKLDLISANPDYRTLENDKKSEATLYEAEKEPDYIFEFFSLNVKAIEEFFEQVKKEREPWTLLGNLTRDKGYSCSSLTLRLLVEGGLNELASGKVRGIVSPTSNVVVSPNNLINQLTLVKAIEERRYPKVLDFKTQSLPDGTKADKESFLVTCKAEKVNIANITKNYLNEVSKDDASQETYSSRRRPS